MAQRECIVKSTSFVNAADAMDPPSHRMSSQRACVPCRKRNINPMTFFYFISDGYCAAKPLDFSNFPISRPPSTRGRSSHILPFLHLQHLNRTARTANRDQILELLHRLRSVAVIFQPGDLANQATPPSCPNLRRTAGFDRVSRSGRRHELSFSLRLAAILFLPTLDRVF